MTYIVTPSRSPFGHPQVHANASAVKEYNGGDTYSAKIPVDFSIVDATVLFVVPFRSILLPDSTFLEIVTGFTGGTSSAVGLSSAQAPYTTKGMLGGGSGGYLTAVIGSAGIVRGIQGTGFTAAPNIMLLEAGSNIRWDLIASQYTAGAGFVHLGFRTVG